LTNPEARVVLAPGAELDVKRLPGFQPGARMTVIANSGTAPVEGIFDGLPEGEKFNIGRNRYRISYKAGATGNDVVLDDIATGTAMIVR